MKTFILCDITKLMPLFDNNKVPPDFEEGNIFDGAALMKYLLSKCEVDDCRIIRLTEEQTKDLIKPDIYNAIGVTI